MIESAAAVPACARTVDAGRRTQKWHSARGTGRLGGWRSGATQRVQAGAGVAESVIYGTMTPVRSRRASEASRASLMSSSA
jgi:hypothetical protein